MQFLVYRELGGHEAHQSVSPIATTSTINHASINGTGLARPGSGPGIVGGPAKNIAGINGSSIRPKHLSRRPAFPGLTTEAHRAQADFRYRFQHLISLDRGQSGSAGGGQAVVADEPAGEARQDRRQGRAPWPLRHLPDGRGRGAERIVPGNPAADRRTATKTGPSVAIPVRLTPRMKKLLPLVQLIREGLNLIKGIVTDLVDAYLTFLDLV